MPRGGRLNKQGEHMPESWDPEIYRQRAAAWRQKAASLPEEHEEWQTCLDIAESYERLARLIESRLTPIA